MFERFSEAARRVVVRAQEEARLLSHGWIGDEHVFLGLIDHGPGSDATEAGAALARAGVTLEAAREAVAAVAGRSDPSPGAIPFTADAKRALDAAMRITLERAEQVAPRPGGPWITTRALLLGVLDEPGPLLDRVLVELDVDRSALVDLAVQAADEAVAPEGAAASSAVRTSFRGLASAGGTAAMTSVTAFGGGWPPPQLQVVRCAFCARPAPISGPLVSGATGTAICGSCVDAAAAVLSAEREVPEGETTPRLWVWDPTARRAVPGMSEDEARVATEEIRSVFERLAEVSGDGADAIVVDGGRGLGRSIIAARERMGFSPGDVRFEVEAVELTTPDRAEVGFRVHSPTGFAPALQGRAVRVDGTWKATRETLAQLLSLAGVQLPPAQ